MEKVQFIDVRLDEEYNKILREVIEETGLKIAAFAENAIFNFVQKEELHEKRFLQYFKRKYDKKNRIKVRINNKDTEEKVKEICEIYGIGISTFIRIALEEALFKYKCLEFNITKEEYTKAKTKSKELKLDFEEFVEVCCNKFLQENDAKYKINLLLKADDVPDNMKKISINFSDNKIKMKVIEESKKNKIPISDFIRVCVNYSI